MVEYATTSGGIVVPLPPNKPDYSSNVTEDQGFFGRVGDALQTLTKTAAQYLVNRELAKLDREDEIKQAEHLAKLRKIEGQAQADRQNLFLGFDEGQQKGIVGISSLGAIAMLGTK